jgi:hypothetical protein
MAFFLYISTCNQAFAFISVASVLPYHPARVRLGTFLRTVASCAPFAHVLCLPQLICMVKLRKLRRLLSVCSHEASIGAVKWQRFGSRARTYVAWVNCDMIDTALLLRWERVFMWINNPTVSLCVLYKVSARVFHFERVYYDHAMAEYLLTERPWLSKKKRG